jgi:predicted nucleic acid-binding protein
VTSWVLDTSVAVAWYRPEAFAQAARRWQAELLVGRARFVVPSLHYWELGNVLRTYVRRGEIEADLAREIYALHLEAPLDVDEPDRAQVLETALSYEATVYDAVFIALSLSTGLPLLTAERTTTPWVIKLGKRVRSLGSPA